MMGEKQQPLRLRSNRKDWIIIIAAAVLVHLAFFIFFKPQYLRIFKTDITGEEGGFSSRPLDRPFTLVPIPDGSKNPTQSPKVKTSDEPQTKRFVLDEIGEPSTELLPITGNSQGKKGKKSGPRKSTVEPKPLFIPWPKYPEGTDAIIEGRVELLLFVNEKGEVAEVKLFRGLPQEILNSVAIEAAREIRFTPGMEKGVPTAMWIRLTIGFQPR